MRAAKQRLPLGHLESRFSREARIQATLHANKELADDLRENWVVTVGPTAYRIALPGYTVSRVYKTSRRLGRNG